MNETDLLASLSVDAEFISATMSLYEGRLVKTDTELFFIADRFSGWEIMERCALVDIQKVEVNDSFMGTIVEIHTSGSHWSLKEVAEGVDVEQWIKGQLSTDTFSNTEKPSPEQVDEKPFEPEVIPSSVAPESFHQTAVSEQGTTEVVSGDTQESNLPEVSEEDLDRMRQVFAVNPKMQVLMAQILDEPFDGTDAQIRLLFQKKPELLSTLRRASSTKFSIIKLILRLGGSNDTPVFKRLVTGCVVLFFLLPFLGTFLAFCVEACFR